MAVLEVNQVRPTRVDPNLPSWTNFLTRSRPRPHKAAASLNEIGRMPSTAISRAISVRLLKFSFRRIRITWFLIVNTLSCNSSAICLLVFPSVMKTAIRCSRSLRTECIPTFANSGLSEISESL